MEAQGSRIESNPNKYEKSVNLLGHIVSQEEIKLNEDKIEQVRLLQTPTKVSQSQSFMDKRFAHMAIPLRKLTGYAWSRECELTIQSTVCALNYGLSGCKYEPHAIYT